MIEMNTDVSVQQATVETKKLKNARDHENKKPLLLKLRPFKK
jgi:hypothetical protein